MPANWSDEEIQRLLGIVLEVKVVDGVGYGFQKKHWTKILAKYNHDWQGSIMSKAQLQNKLTQLKKKYIIFFSIVNSPGFEFHEGEKIVTAPDEVWDAYLMTHPNALEFRHNSLRWYDELHQIYTTSIGSGNFADGSGKVVENSTNSQESPDVERILPFDLSNKENYFQIDETLPFIHLPPMSPLTSSQSLATASGVVSPTSAPLVATEESRPQKRMRISTKQTSIERIAIAIKSIADFVVKKDQRDLEQKENELAQTLKAISAINKDFADKFSLKDRAKMVYIIGRYRHYVPIFLGLDENMEVKTMFLQMLLIHPLPN